MIISLDNTYLNLVNAILVLGIIKLYYFCSIGTLKFGKFFKQILAFKLG